MISAIAIISISSQSRLFTEEPADSVECLESASRLLLLLPLIHKSSFVQSTAICVGRLVSNDRKEKLIRCVL